jgi:hypothetical protein
MLLEGGERLRLARRAAVDATDLDQVLGSGDAPQLLVDDGVAGIAKHHGCSKGVGDLQGGAHKTTVVRN